MEKTRGEIKLAFQRTIEYWKEMQTLLEKNIDVEIDSERSIYSVGNVCLHFGNGKVIKHGAESCRLCLIIFDCTLCPIGIDTKQISCYGTPYYEWGDAVKDCCDVVNQELIDIHQKEVDYLEGLYKTWEEDEG